MVEFYVKDTPQEPLLKLLYEGKATMRSLNYLEYVGWGPLLVCLHKVRNFYSSIFVPLYRDLIRLNPISWELPTL